MLINKRGTDKVLAVYWFAILIIVTVAIVSGVSIFYGAQYDVRDVESIALANKIADCVSKGGKMNYLMDEKEINSDNFLSICRLNFANQEQDLYAEVDFYDFDSCSINDKKCSVSLLNVKTFTQSWIEQCNLDSKGPVCKERWFYTLSKDGQQEIIIRIFTGVNKAGENVN